jgi:hypothetical protein
MLNVVAPKKKIVSYPASLFSLMFNSNSLVFSEKKFRKKIG